MEEFEDFYQPLVIENLESHLNFKFSKKYFTFRWNFTRKKKPFTMCQYHSMVSDFPDLQFVRASPTSFPAGPLEKLKSKFICNHVAICIIYWFIHSIRSCFVSCIVSFNQSHHHGFMSCKLVTFHILVGEQDAWFGTCLYGHLWKMPRNKNITQHYEKSVLLRKRLQTQVPAIIIWIAMSYWTNISLLTSRCWTLKIQKMGNKWIYLICELSVTTCLSTF
jgi:hypothetical protein